MGFIVGFGLIFIGRVDVVIYFWVFSFLFVNGIRLVVISMDLNFFIVVSGETSILLIVLLFIFY